MKKNKIKLLLVFVLVLVACLSFAACNTTLEQLKNDYGITVEGGGFDKGASLVSEVIDATSEKGIAAIQAIAEQNYNMTKDVHIFDIFVAKDGAEVQPNGKVKVTIPAPVQNVIDYIVFHIKDSGTVEALAATFADGKISFETDSFSYFVVAPTYQFYVEVKGEGNGRVTVDGETFFSYADKYVEGEKVMLEAVPQESSAKFVGWYVNDELVSSETTFEFTMPAAAYRIQCKFDKIPEYLLNVSTTPADSGVVSLDGNADLTNMPFIEAYCLEGFTQKLTASVSKPESEYRFVGWYLTDEADRYKEEFISALSTSETFEFNMPSYNYNITAVFEEIPHEHSWSADWMTSENGHWHICTGCDEIKDFAAHSYDNGVVTKPATETETGIMTYTCSVCGYFYTEEIPLVIPEQYSLTVGQIGAGGSIRINESTAQSYESLAYNESFAEGTEITLVAQTRSDDYIFKGWFEPTEEATTFTLKDTPESTNMTYTFSISGDYAVYAVFETIPTYSFNASVYNGGGTISENSDVLVNGYFENHPTGTKITLTATPAYGYEFKGWFEPDETTPTHVVLKATAVSTSATYEFTVPTNDYTVYAVFETDEKVEFRALVGNQSGTISEGATPHPNGYYGRLSVGAKVTLTATPDTGYTFKGWYEAETETTTLTFKADAVSTAATYEFTVPESDYTIYAVFEAMVTALNLDGANAGFTGATTDYTIGTDGEPVPANVVVYGVTVEGNVYLTLDVDYTIDLGGVDFTATGTYTITYTYVNDTTIEATLTVIVEKPKYAFSAYVGTEGGTIMSGETVLPNGYYGELEEGAKVTLSATANDGYNFVGWYEKEATQVGETERFKDTAVSTSATYEFTTTASEYTVYAVFELTVTGLELDGANAGFTDGSATYVIGSEYQPDPSMVVVYGTTAQDRVFLTKDTDYTIDLGGLDFETVGEYTVTYSYVKNTSLTASVTVSVVAEIEMRITYAGLTEDSEKYNGGTAAYINKSMFLINGVDCEDISAVSGLSFEWRDHTTHNVVAAVNDWTLDDPLFESPAVVGTYDFVIYLTSDELKTPLVTVTRTITTNLFELATTRSQVNGGYNCNVIVGIVDGNYYVMRMPSLSTDTAREVEGIPVSADENGRLIVGDEYAYTFRTYHYLNAQRHAPRDDTSPDTLLYDFRTGDGPYQLGTLLLYNIGIVVGGATGDSGILISFNEDYTANISEPFMATAKIRLVYDSTSGKYLFTSSTATETRTTYPVYIYSEYVESGAPTSQYEYIGAPLSKAYDGNFVTVNAYKDLIISTENGDDLFNLLKMGTGRLAWLDASEMTVVEGTDGTIAEDGTVTGPSAVGSYVLVLQLAEELKDGTTVWNNVTLHEFTISAAE